jgi:hypothetical protein
MAPIRLEPSCCYQLPERSIHPCEARFPIFDHEGGIPIEADRSLQGHAMFGDIPFLP